jgi:type IV pilus assembly protein PilE
MQQNKQYGFSLIELMIVLAIIGVLAKIAYPSYQDSMTKSRRADAKSALLELSVFMERLYTTTGCYNPGLTDKVCGDANDAAPKLPFDIAPKSAYNPSVASSGVKANYDLTVVATASTFTVTAAPRSATVPDIKCGSLTLDNTNTKSTSVAAALSSPAKETLIGECW